LGIVKVLIKFAGWLKMTSDMKLLFLTLALMMVTGITPVMTGNVKLVSASYEFQKPKAPPTPKKVKTPAKPKQPPKAKAPAPVKKPKAPSKPRWVK
jgi:hypothetical protein